MNQTSSAFAPFVGGPGLQVSISPGTILCANIATKLPLTVVPLTANATNFVYIKILEIGNISAGNPAQLTPIITASTDSTQAPDGIPIATVITGTSSVLSLVDTRPDLIL